MISYGVVVHGGAGSSGELSEGCRAACEAAFRMLAAGNSALDAAVEAARLLEDDGRFNAGRGSVLRMDGETIEMDAAVADSTGKIGVVINIREVKNPVLVALAVTGTPHVALAGRGAEAFARSLGFAPYHDFSRKAGGRGGTSSDTIGADTIGVVALDRRGIFALATSTGGAAPMMVGRVGDTPMIGCGFYAGPGAAVAVTGLGEESIRKMLAKSVYDMIAGEMDALSACEKGIGLVAPGIKMGVIAISRRDWSAKASGPMAHCGMICEKAQ
ncbi:MAG: isoaspartyl peptidase/L-asparaginase [Desulfobacteraceae bacterium]|nr:isoaspartyl peptidase/L-asparaginase [Desulfobacteraceae bacterium]